MSVWSLCLWEVEVSAESGLCGACGWGNRRSRLLSRHLNLKHLAHCLCSCNPNSHVLDYFTATCWLWRFTDYVAFNCYEAHPRWLCSFMQSQSHMGTLTVVFCSLIDMHGKIRGLKVVLFVFYQRKFLLLWRSALSDRRQDSTLVLLHTDYPPPPISLLFIFFLQLKVNCVISGPRAALWHIA